MADKRIYQLDTATTLTGKYVIVDKTGNSDAERYPIEDLLPTSIYRCRSVSVASGEQTVTFTEAFPVGTSYQLLPLSGYNADEGYMYTIPYDLTITDFKVNFPFAVTFTYLAIVLK